MRIVRSYLVLLVFAVTASGCAGQPAPWLAMAGRPAPAVAAPAPSGIDATVYGSAAPSPMRPVPARIVAAPVVAAPLAAARGDRGFMATGTVPVPVVPHFVRAPIAPVAFAPAPPPGPYTLDSGDRLRIVVFGQDGLSNSYIVDASGHIAMPLIGSVMARGASTDELSSRIADRLRQGFIKEPHVAVEVEAYRPFFILGEVGQPGQYPFVSDMTAETAVAIAGGFGARAYRRTVIVTRTINGQPVRLTVPVNFPIRPGDTINVQERWF